LNCIGGKKFTFADFHPICIVEMILFLHEAKRTKPRRLMPVTGKVRLVKDLLDFSFHRVKVEFKPGRLIGILSDAFTDYEVRAKLLSK